MSPHNNASRRPSGPLQSSLDVVKCPSIELESLMFHTVAQTAQLLIDIVPRPLKIPVRMPIPLANVLCESADVSPKSIAQKCLAC